MRKAVIVPFALGMVIFSALVLLGGSVADNMLLKNRYFKLKEFTEKSAIAAANYYNNGEDTDTAETSTKTLMQTHPLYPDISNELVFDWRLLEEKVVVSIANHNFDTFWLKMFSLDSIPMHDINSTAEILSSDEVVSDQSCKFTPITINEQNLSIGQQITLSFQVLESSGTQCCLSELDENGDETLTCVDSIDDTCEEGWMLSTQFDDTLTWDSDDLTTFYGVDLFAATDNLHGADHIVTWRKIIDGSKSFTLTDCFSNNVNLLDVESDIQFLGGYLGDDNNVPDEAVQITDAVKAFEALLGGSGTIDIAMIDATATLSGFISVNLVDIQARDNGTPDSRYLDITLEVTKNQNNNKVTLVD